MELDFEIFHHNVHLQMTSFFSKIKAYYPYIFLKKEERIFKTRSILFEEIFQTFTSARMS
ncbi:hypothetical protein EGD80_03445 [Bacillus subtilis]|uniref:Uncharacterized protein n=1 Tax=Bacillus subtilis TaxID=1423 RepID=A0A0C3FPK1_BACIU|nr:hypothetical protein BSR08_09365 [Bacillus subtilis]AXC53593.1 hypothetical protein DQ231_12340 [Bacillus spizizenii]AYK68073.1 hypothetical protein D9C11_02315 [Bacillus subtilis subsp. subtilis]MUF99508.1 hypothetical protein [Bacillus tequilensis]NOV07461.1 hypothetical protein [Bacillus sp. seq1]POX32691.1 hypothetical protein C3465_16615 [Bacillus sp. Ru63]PTN29553.1 hypothetical protein DAD79_17075 [Bacillus sp. Rc4]CCU59036.1 hypothetical protein BSUBE1_2405 [Bacillus subtilis E1]